MAFVDRSNLTKDGIRKAVAEFATAARTQGLRALRWAKQVSAPLRSWLRKVYGRLSLAQKIIILNGIMLLGLLGSIVYFSQHDAWLTAAKRDSLEVQGKIIAETIARQVARRRTVVPMSDIFGEFGTEAEQPLPSDTFEFKIPPDTVAPIFRSLLKPGGARGRVYNADGVQILDSNRMVFSGRVGHTTSGSDVSKPPSFISKNWSRFLELFRGRTVPLYRDIGKSNGSEYKVVKSALAGKSSAMLMRTHFRGQIVAVGVPIRQNERILGALMMTTASNTLQDLVDRERRNTIILFVLAGLATMLLALALRQAIVRPLRKLSNAADHVKHNLNARTELPEFPDRQDEIGHLAVAFSEMTSSLLKRIDASEKFAADVSHELRNPLTSVRSAAESLSYAKKEEDKEQLIATIINDVDRLNRLIADISSASKLDAELALTASSPVELTDLVHGVVEMLEDQREKYNVDFKISIPNIPLGSAALAVTGHENRLAQVVINLISNALTFSPNGASIMIGLQNVGSVVRLTVEDEGPGIPAEALEKVFKRFYTHRPEEDAFANNSGLGLSISQEIVEAHRGKIWAENRLDDDGDIDGARFVVELPGMVVNEQRHAGRPVKYTRRSKAAKTN